jgi:hypothetical protein
MIHFKNTTKFINYKINMQVNLYQHFMIASGSQETKVKYDKIHINQNVLCNNMETDFKI